MSRLRCESCGLATRGPRSPVRWCWPPASPAVAAAERWRRRTARRTRNRCPDGRASLTGRARPNELALTRAWKARTVEVSVGALRSERPRDDQEGRRPHDPRARRGARSEDLQHGREGACAHHRPRAHEGENHARRQRDLRRAPGQPHTRRAEPHGRRRGRGRARPAQTLATRHARRAQRGRSKS